MFLSALFFLRLCIQFIVSVGFFALISCTVYPGRTLRVSQSRRDVRSKHSESSRPSPVVVKASITSFVPRGIARHSRGGRIQIKDKRSRTLNPSTSSSSHADGTTSSETNDAETSKRSSSSDRYASRRSQTTPQPEIREVKKMSNTDFGNLLFGKSWSSLMIRTTSMQFYFLRLILVLVSRKLLRMIWKKNREVFFHFRLVLATHWQYWNHRLDKSLL